MTDWHRLISRLEPPPDGEGPVMARTGMVTVVNANGTVNLTMGGQTLTQVHVLQGATTTVGQPVIILVWKGGMIVLGRVRTS